MLLFKMLQIIASDEHVFSLERFNGCLKTKGHLEIFTLRASEEHVFSLEKFTWVLEN